MIKLRTSLVMERAGLGQWCARLHVDRQLPYQHQNVVEDLVIGCQNLVVI